MVGGRQELLITVTLVEALAKQPEAFVLVTVYVPCAAVVTLVIDSGFCNIERNPFGPDQDQDVPAFKALELRVNVPPAVTGLLLVAVGIGTWLTVMANVHVLVQPPFV